MPEKSQDRNMMRFLVLVACFAALMVVTFSTFSMALETKATTTYQVPTTGEIMDVVYLPEFDEWWVKCREGKGISIYSYDKRSKKWGHALFVPRRLVEKKNQTMIPEKPVKSEESTTSSQTENLGPTTVKKRETSPDEGKIISGSQHPPGKSDSESDKKKWWDPLNLLKGDKRTIPPVDQPLP